MLFHQTINSKSRPLNRDLGQNSTRTTERRKAKSVLKNYEDFSPPKKPLPPVIGGDGRRLSSAMIPDKTLKYTIPDRTVKRHGIMSKYSSSGKGNYQPISPLKYHGNGGNPHFHMTAMETNFSKFSR
jgi:hypothetical protein